jgi:hypothetical protein
MEWNLSGFSLAIGRRRSNQGSDVIFSVIQHARKHALAISERSRIASLANKLRACSVQRVSIDAYCKSSIWLPDLIQLADLSYIEVRNSISRRSQLTTPTSVPQLQDINGQGFRYVNVYGKMLEDLIQQSSGTVDIDLRVVTGLQGGAGQDVAFRSMTEYYRHPHCQTLLLKQRMTVEQWVAQAFGPEKYTRFLLPRWSAAHHDHVPRLYWLNTGSPQALAIAQAKMLRDGSAHSVRGELEVLQIRPKVLSDLQSMCSMVAVNNQASDRLGLYDLLRTVDFPVLALHGLAPFSPMEPEREPRPEDMLVKTTRRTSTSSALDILLFPRSHPMSAACAEILLANNAGADFGAFLSRLMKSQ